MSKFHNFLCNKKNPERQKTPSRVFLFDWIDKKPGLFVQWVQPVHQIFLFSPLSFGVRLAILEFLHTSQVEDFRQQ